MRRWMAPLLAVGLVGCSSGLNRPVKEVTAKADTDGVQRVRVVAHTYWFEPNRIVLKSGVPVELTVKNGAFLVPHNFTCNAGEAGLLVSENLGMFMGSKRVRLTPTQPGEYEFFCHVGSHAKHGMKGKFVVVP